MNKFDLISFTDPEALARAAAGEWLSQLRRRPAGARYCVALSGGRIARNFLTAVAASARSIDFAAVHFFWGDERCVPPEDPESNFSLAQEALLEPRQIPAAHIHRIRGEMPPETAASEAEQQLRRLAPVNAEDQPVLDLVFLGMGEDGHVASLFPNGPEPTLKTRAVFLPVSGPKPPPNRISLTYAAIAAAREVWVLASGPHKAAALRDSLAPKGRTPLASVIHLRSQTRIFAAVTD